MLYTVQQVKPWKVEPRNGRYAYSVVFEEHQNEPVDYFSATEPKEGDKVEGKIEASPKGRPTFYEPYKLDRHQANIVSQWAVGNAAQYVSDHTNQDELYAVAEIFLDTAMRLAEAKSE